MAEMALKATSERGVTVANAIYWHQQRQNLAINVGAAAAVILLLLIFLLLGIILLRGGAYFWPASLAEVVDKRGQPSFQHWPSELHSEDSPVPTRYPPDLAQITLHSGAILLLKIDAEQATYYQQNQNTVRALTRQIRLLKQGELADVNQQLAIFHTRGVAENAPARQRYLERYQRLQQDLQRLNQELIAYQLYAQNAKQDSHPLAMGEIQRIDWLNQLSWLARVAVFFSNIADFVTGSPTQVAGGGVYAALFGTVMMVLLMTVFVTPLGVLAAVFLHEYAPNNRLTRLVRLAVNNLAGVPSIVFGVFGLGFFVYTLGGNLDQLLFSDELPTPTLGSPGLLWAALTMALLTLPVVIVATEEGLKRVPNNIRKGSYALGATQAETLWRTLLPIASPGIMTGVILAIARGAGEVAPLMLVGAVKYAPSLPVDGNFPYLHLDRQFMHLGTLIYDGAFNQQNTAYMFASCLLLLVIVFMLNLLAIWVRGKLRRHYARIQF